MDFPCKILRRFAGLVLGGNFVTMAEDPETKQLVDQAAQGDAAARGQLLHRFRHRLRAMIGLRMDRRLAARIDPSDVVQETLADAVQQLSDYLRRQPLPFYPWLRQLARDRLADFYRLHVLAQKRSVRREEPWIPPLPDESAVELADRLVSAGITVWPEASEISARDQVFSDMF
jgi:RNA polymerase sigma-70 factor (ECF subfamily)